VPSMDTFAKFGELLFSFNYTQIIIQTDVFTNPAEQIAYLLFVITEAKRIVNVFNLYEDGTIDIKTIFEIKPLLETGFLAVINKFAGKKLKAIKSGTKKNELELLFDIESEYYNYVDKVKSVIPLLETELGYRKNIVLNSQYKPANSQNQEELFVKEKKLIPKIKWYRTEQQLYKLFTLLTQNKFIKNYENSEIISHFAICNSNNRISLFCPTDKRFLWHGSDNEFCFLVNLLVKKKIIPAHKKYKIVSNHFLNREGTNFIYLAQKHNFTKNYLQTKTLLIDIVKEVDMQK